MRTTPRSEDELRPIAKEGAYDFEVLEAVDQLSKNKNEMIKLTIGIYDGDRIRFRIFDYILDSMGFKLRHFCDATGLLAKYEAGTLQASDCVGRAGKVKIGIETDKENKYPPKNKVMDYICREAKPIGGAPEQAGAVPPHNDSDELPF